MNCQGHPVRLAEEIEMKLKIGSAAAWLLAAVAFVASGTAMATNGYFTHGVGTQSKGMAGTGIGSNADMGPIMSASNPALAVFTSDRWEVGLAIFSPMRSYETGPSQLNGALIDLGGGVFLPSFTITPGKIDSSSEFFPIPFVAKNWSLANGGNITGTFYGRGGMNTDWDDANASATSFFCDNTGQSPTPVTGPGPYCAGVAGVDLSQAFLAVNYSAQVNDNFSWGIGPILAVQLFEAKGIATFTPITKTFAESGGTVFPTALTDNGHDTSFGFGFGAGMWWGITDRVGFGLSYQSKLSMDEFSDYADLFAQAGGFDIPASTKAGLSFLATDALRVNLDVEFTQFSDVDSVGNPMANMLTCPTLPFGGTDLESCLGGGAGAGFGWEDMTTYKIGFEYAQNESNTWRFGYSYGEQPIQEADVLFNILAPGVMEQHITFGLTRQTSGGGVLSFSFMYAPEKSVTGPNMFDPTQTIELSMDQFEFELSYLF
jgi:long-chain fatty acid transport protein